MNPQREDLSMLLEVAPEIQTAVEEGKPVVALESTIITHGMSYPENIESAMVSERTIRNEGAVPATIALIKGKMKVGLNADELEFFGKNGSIRKASRRDLPMILAKGLDGATTVATTMIGAQLAGIHFFATGGIGGVHRGAAETFDVSADLMELARTPVAVICAGAKSILDIGLTLEVLETHGVPVVGNRTDAFPGFYIRESGFGVDDRSDDLMEIARALALKWSLGLEGGMVVANPIPAEFEMEPGLIGKGIDEAVAEADRMGVRGKALTPFILSRLHRVTEGKSLAANKELVYHNSRVAAQLAGAYAAFVSGNQHPAC